jgi:hypothetical protein
MLHIILLRGIKERKKSVSHQIISLLINFPITLALFVDFEGKKSSYPSYFCFIIQFLAAHSLSHVHSLLHIAVFSTLFIMGRMHDEGFSDAFSVQKFTFSFRKNRLDLLLITRVCVQTDEDRIIQDEELIFVSA